MSLSLPAFFRTAIFGTTLLAAGTAFAQQPQMDLERVRISAGMYQIDAQVAATPEQRQTGLMFRKEMPQSEGMVFVFEQSSPQCFWMKNTLIPLDMIFIAADGTVKHVHANAVPLSTDTVPSRYPVRAVLEINGGSAALLGIKPGDKVKHPIFGNA